jgi:anti-sigma B factor antagonist
MATERPFSAQVVREGRRIVVDLAGELDLGTVAELEAALPAPARGDLLVVDLRKLRFIDSSGLHALMRLDAAARGEGWTFALVRGGERVQRVLDICRIGDHVTLVGAPEEAA